MWKILRHPADAALAGSVRFYCNHKLRGMGEMTEFAIDTKNKSVRLRLELVGEAEPIEVQVTRYALKQKGAETRLVVEEATASREWMTVALREFVIGKSFIVPSHAGTLLKLLV
jgi:hypothetical protein